MAIEPKTLESPAEVERRRSRRVHIVLPVELRWLTEEGAQAGEAETELVSAHGALLRMKTRFPIPSYLELRNSQSGQSARVQAVWKDTNPDGTTLLAVALESPSETFWGVRIPPVPQQ